jgi:histidine triad (HIT) family protein
MTRMSTIFSKIISKDVPADIVYEDDIVLAFLDIHPIQPGHTLIIPKVPSDNGIECNPDTLGHIMKIAQQIARAQMEILECDGVNFFMNNGAAAGQEVFHTHLHVIPRFTDDNTFEKPLRGEYENGEATSLAASLATALKG